MHTWKFIRAITAAVVMAATPSGFELCSGSNQQFLNGIEAQAGV